MNSCTPVSSQRESLFGWVELNERESAEVGRSSPLLSETVSGQHRGPAPDPLINRLVHYSIKRPARNSSQSIMDSLLTSERMDAL